MVEFDPYAPSFLADPYPVYDRLRTDVPIFHDDTWGLTFFTRHADVTAMLRDRRFGRDVRHALDPASDVEPELYRRIYPPQYPAWTDTIRDSFIDLEPPRHTAIRSLVNKAFTRRTSETYRAGIRATVEDLLDRLVEERAFDVIPAFATPVPLAMITSLLGIPPGDDHDQLIEWSHRIVRLFDEDVTAEEGAAAEEATIAFRDYARELVARRRAAPGDDLVSGMLQVEEEGRRLSEDDVVRTVILVLNAGHEATVHAIGNGLLALHRHPAAWQQLRSDPDGLARTAAAELLRFDSPLQMFERWILEDLEWEGVRLEAGRKVGLLFGSANRDPDAFERPDVLDLSRHPNPHVSFGGGIHFCVGGPLAEVELQEAFAGFARRVARFELDTEHLQRIRSLVFRGVGRLRVELEPA